MYFLTIVDIRSTTTLIVGVYFEENTNVVLYACQGLLLLLLRFLHLLFFFDFFSLPFRSFFFQSFQS